MTEYNQVMKLQKLMYVSIDTSLNPGYPTMVHLAGFAGLHKLMVHGKCNVEGLGQ